MVQRSVPVLRYLEKVVHPRWHTPIKATKRLVGTVVVILSTTLVFIPIPLSNVVPALVIALISLAYLEEDGVLLSIALLATVIVMTVDRRWPSVRAAPPSWGRHPQTFTRTEVASYSVISSADEQAGKRETSSLPAG